MKMFMLIRRVLVIFSAIAMLFSFCGPARADDVDDVLASNFGWRGAHPVSKARFRLIGGDGAPVGWYYLDLQTASFTEVAIMSILLGKTELVVRSVKRNDVGRFFFNEDAYLELDSAALSTLGNDGFWQAQDVAGARASLSTLFDIQGVTTKTVDGVTYSGIDMDLNQGRWDAYRGSIGSNLVVNLPANMYTDITVFFGPTGELHSVDMMSPDVNVEMLFHDWQDIGLAEIDDARQSPHGAQERWDMPLDEATIQYISRLTQ